nr:Gfo/Idh/MocA family oxidoreductase [Candidatus Sigynarchaeota archaeon]
MLNILIVGAGGHAQSWNAYIKLHPGWKLVGIVDTDTEKLEHATLWGVPEECAYPSIEDAIRWSEEKIDVALITTPIPTHHLIATEAIGLGLHVILEKNMAVGIDQGRELVKLTRKHPELCTMMGTQYRFRPLWWTINQMLAEEDPLIGRLSFLRARSTAYSGTMRSGWRAFMEDIFPSDMFIHHCDLLRYVPGMEIVKVQAQVFKPAWSKWLGSSTVTMNLVMAPKGKERDRDSWVQGQYYGDWQGTGLKAAWEELVEFYGPKGSIRVEPPLERPKESWARDPALPMPLAGEPPGARIIAYLDHDGNQQEVKEIPRRKDVGFNPHGYIDQMYLLDEMLECIKSKGKQQPATCFEDGYKSFLVTRAAIESSRTGSAIWLPKYWLEPLPEP